MICPRKSVAGAVPTHVSAADVALPVGEAVDADALADGAKNDEVTASAAETLTEASVKSGSDP